jgi:hypothetical protein
VRTLFLVLVILFYSLPAFAQEKTVDKKFIVVNGFLVSATVFDIETTYIGLENCSRCKELNPVMRPFVNSGRPAIYTVEMGINAGMIYYSYKLKKRGSKLWWVIPVAVGAAHGVAGGSNLKFSTKFTF